MTQVSPEVISYDREHTVVESAVERERTTEDVVVLGEDLSSFFQEPGFIGPQFLSIHDPEFVGPHDATNEAHGLYLSQARDLAQIAVMNAVAYGPKYCKVINEVKTNVSKGLLRLGSEPIDMALAADGTSRTDMTFDQQVALVMGTAIKAAYRPYVEVSAELKAKEEAIAASLGGPGRVLKQDLAKAHEKIDEQHGRMLSARNMLRDKRVSVDVLDEFDYITGWMPQPEQEAYESKQELGSEGVAISSATTEEVRIYGKFKDILRYTQNFSVESLRRIRLIAPRSGEVKIVQPSDVDILQ